MKPLWIVIDGIDGAGKTTLCKNLETALNLRNDTEAIHLPYEHAVYYQDIRDMLKEKDQSKSDPLQYKMIANYRDTLKNFIIPMLKKGTNVILDRWITSTIAYNLYDQGNLMIELCNLSWMMSYSESDLFTSHSKIMNIDIIHNIITTGIDLCGYTPDALMYLIPDQNIINKICQKRKEEGSKEVNDVDYVKISKINKIFANMGKMTSYSISYKNGQGMDMIDDITFAYTDISKVVSITGVDTDYYMTLFPDAMEVIHRVLEKQICSDDFSVSKTDITDYEQYQDTECADPCAIVGMHPSDSPSYYDEH